MADTTDSPGSAAAGGVTQTAGSTGTRSILPTDMISVEEARERILEVFEVLPAQPTPLLEAVGQVLAGDITAGFSIPPLANTAMDGYAVRAEDTSGATYDTPLTLEVVGYLAAGSIYEGEVGPGQAVRIMTGAPIPADADAVVPFEETDEDDINRGAGGAPRVPDAASVRIDVEARLGANVRLAGEDVREGETVLRAGTVLQPAQVGVLASLGVDSAVVYRRPVVAILSTGDELVRPGQPLGPGKIYDSNAFALAAQVEAYGGVPRVLDVALDTVEALTARIHEGLADADLLVTSAGVSRGDFDVVKTVLAAKGEVGFWTVRMKPGKPLAFGTFRGPGGHAVPHLGLPGNPVSAMMTFELFGRPAMFKMLGKLQHDPDAWQRPMVRAITEDRIRNTDLRRFFARCRVTQDAAGGWTVRLTGPQGSGVLTSMSLANGYAICPEDRESIEPGEECDVILIDREQPVPSPRGG